MVRPIVLLALMLAAAALSQQQCEDAGCPKGFAPKHHRLLEYGYCKHPLFIQDAKKKCPKTCFTCYTNFANAYCVDHPQMSVGDSALRQEVGESCADGQASGRCDRSNLGSDAGRLFLAACARTCTSTGQHCTDYAGIANRYAGNTGVLFEASIKPRKCVDDATRCFGDFIGSDSNVCTHPYNIERIKLYCPELCFSCDLSKAVATCEDSPGATLIELGFDCAVGKRNGYCDLTDDLKDNINRRLFLLSCPVTCGYCKDPPQEIIDAIHGNSLLRL